jgi:hypothetical protein
MASQPEALAQVSRLLADGRLRNASPAEVDAALEKGFDLFVEGLVAEAAASDDVSDRDSALAFLDDRLAFFEGLISAEQRARLREALQKRIETW